MEFYKGKTKIIEE